MDNSHRVTPVGRPGRNEGAPRPAVLVAGVLLAALLAAGRASMEAPRGGLPDTAAVGPPAAPAQTVDGTVLLKQIDRGLNPESYESYRRIINAEPDGRQREFLLYSVKSGRDRVAALFLSPASDKGRSTLRLGENMWLYVPNAGKPIRITSLQSVIGGVFNNADILSLDYADEYDVQRAVVEGEARVLHLKARSATVAYDRLTMQVDGSRPIPTRIECLTATGVLVKTLHFKQVTDFGGGIVRPAVIETDSPLQKGYRSTMVFAKLAKRTFSDEVFSLTFMPNLETLRR